MSYQLADWSLKLLINYAAELAAKRVLCATGRLRPYMTKAEAFRLCGRSNVEHWIDSGLMAPRKDGNHSSTWRIDRMELESIRFAIELSRYL